MTDLGSLSVSDISAGLLVTQHLAVGLTVFGAGATLGVAGAVRFGRSRQHRLRRVGATDVREAAASGRTVLDDALMHHAVIHLHPSEYGPC